MQTADPITAGKLIGAVVIANVGVVVVGIRLAIQRIRAERDASVILWPAYIFLGGSMALCGAGTWFVQNPGFVPLVVDGAVASVVLWAAWLLWTTPFRSSSSSHHTAT
jgi:hypothetical protein